MSACVRKCVEACTAAGWFVQSMAALLAPIGACTETLNTALMKTVLRPVLERSVNYVKELTEDNLREKVG